MFTSTVTAPAAAPRIEPSARVALTKALAALDAAEARGEPMTMAEALMQVAQRYETLKMQTHRRWYLQQALRFTALLGGVDASVQLHCELAEAFADDAEDAGNDDPVGRAQSRDHARDHVYEAARMAHRSADPQWEVTVLMRVSRLLDSIGDHEDALALQRRARDLQSQTSSLPSSAA